MLFKLAATLVVIVGGQDIFLAAKPSRLECKPANGLRLEPSPDPFQELCYLLYKNAQEYTISWTYPGMPAATLQDHITYDLVTMWKLGADAAQLNASYEFHVKDELLKPLQASKGSVDESTWKARIGKNPVVPDIDYPDFLDFYRKQIAKNGVDNTLVKHLPSLVDGVFGKMFHGQQMLGWSYGETGDADMVAQGLAWMSSAFQPPAPLAKTGSKKDMSKVFAAMHSDKRLPDFKGDAVLHYMSYFNDLVANYSIIMAEYDLDVPDDISVDAAREVAKHMQDATFKLFAAYGFFSFVVLHCASAARNVYNLMDLLPAAARAQLLRREWQGILYNYALQNRPSPALPSLPVKANRSWDEILAGNFKQTEYHLHELVFYTKENLCGTDPVLMQIAADKGLALIESGGTWKF